jgi:hypothetical protein
MRKPIGFPSLTTLPFRLSQATTRAALKRRGKTEIKWSQNSVDAERIRDHLFKAAYEAFRNALEHDNRRTLRYTGVFLS